MAMPILRSSLRGAVKMDVFTEFRRGKTIDNRELEPHTPSGNYPGHPGTDPAMYHRVSCPFIYYSFSPRARSETEFQP